MNKLNHFDENGNAIMVDVSEKNPTKRIASASGKIFLSKEAFEKVIAGEIKKGDAIAVARIAGIMAIKNTSRVIPLCHNINLTQAKMDFEFDYEKYFIKAVSTVSTISNTGVEMEAIYGVSVSLVSIYDMVKAIDKNMLISDIKLEYKKGGKEDFKRC